MKRLLISAVLLALAATFLTSCTTGPREQSATTTSASTRTYSK